MVNRTAPPAWRTASIVAAGARVAAFEAGSDADDAPLVVLLHGLGHWSDAAWSRLVPYLDSSFRYLAFDLPGFGASERPDAPYDRAFFRLVLADVVDACGRERVALVGHSLGGFIAADFAGAYPERVTHLALIAPAGFARTPRHLLYALASGFGHRLFTRRPSRAFVVRELRQTVRDPATLEPETIERAVALSQDLAVRRAFAAIYASALRTFANRRGVHAHFARYTGPVWCAWGRHDRYARVAALRGVFRVYPCARTLILEHSGHLPMVEEPRVLGAVLREFLQ